MPHLPNSSISIRSGRTGTTRSAAIVFRVLFLILRDTNVVVANLAVAAIGIVQAILKATVIPARAARAVAVVYAFFHTRAAHAFLKKWTGHGQIRTPGKSVAFIDRARVAVTALRVILTIKTPAVFATLTIVAAGCVGTKRRARAVDAVFKERTDDGLLRAARTRIATVDRAWIVLLAYLRISIAGVEGAIFKAPPVGVALAHVGPDARSAAVAVAQVATVIHRTRNRSDAFPTRFASAGVRSDARSVVAVADVAAMELVAALSLPTRFAQTQTAESAARAVTAIAIGFHVTVAIVVDQVGNTVAVVVIIFRRKQAITVDIVVESVGFAVTVYVWIIAVFNTVAIDVGIRTVRNAVSVNVRPVLRIVGIAAARQLFQIAQPVMIAVDRQNGGDLFIRDRTTVAAR